MSQQHTSRSSFPHGAQDPKPSKQEIPAATVLIIVLSPDVGRPVKPAIIIYPFQDQADGASLAPSSSVEAGRSDPDRQVDGTSDQTWSKLRRRNVEIAVFMYVSSRVCNLWRLRARCSVLGARCSVLFQDIDA